MKRIFRFLIWLAITSSAYSQTLIFKPHDFYLEHSFKSIVSKESDAIKIKSCVTEEIKYVPSTYLPLNDFKSYELKKNTSLSDLISEFETKTIDVDIALFWIANYINPENGQEQNLGKIANIFIVNVCDKTFALDVFWSKTKNTWLLSFWSLDDVKVLLDYADKTQLLNGVKIFYRESKKPPKY